MNNIEIACHSAFGQLVLFNTSSATMISRCDDYVLIRNHGLECMRNEIECENLHLVDSNYLLCDEHSASSRRSRCQGWESLSAISGDLETLQTTQASESNQNWPQAQEE